MNANNVTAAVAAAIAESIRTDSIAWLYAEGDPDALDCYRDTLYAECDDHVEDVTGADGRYDDFWGEADAQAWRICLSH
jgi:hypothetical protein